MLPLKYITCKELMPYYKGSIPGPAVNTLRPRQNGHHFADDNFKCIFSNENVRIAIQISPKFVPKGRLNNIPSLVQIKAWRRPGDKPLSEQMMVILPTHICVARPQWAKALHSLPLWSCDCAPPSLQTCVKSMCHQQNHCIRYSWPGNWNRPVKNIFHFIYHVTSCCLIGIEL